LTENPDPRACTLLRINLHEIARRLASAFQPWEEEHARGEHP